MIWKVLNELIKKSQKRKKKLCACIKNGKVSKVSEIIRLYSSSSETNINSSSGASLLQDEADCKHLRFSLFSARIFKISEKMVSQWSFVRALTMGMY